MMCELSHSSHDPLSLAASAKGARDLRNSIVHRGVRISAGQASQAFEAVDFVLRASTPPSTKTPEPFDTSNWIEHFGSITEDLVSKLGRSTGRLVLHRAGEKRKDPLTYPFTLTRLGDTFTVTIPPHVREPEAAALVVVTSDSFDYESRGRYPHLSFSDEAKKFLVAGLIDTLAGTINQALYVAFAMLVRGREGMLVEAASDYMLSTLVGTFREIGHTFETDDVRVPGIGARMGSYLLGSSEGARQAFVAGLGSKHVPLVEAALAFADMFAKLDADDPHSMCDVLRAIHTRMMWLDSMLVKCPTERATY